MAKVRVTETERLVILADGLGWPIIKEDYDHNDVLVKDKNGYYIWWQHENGKIVKASDNLGPIRNMADVEEYIRGRGNEDYRDRCRRAGLGDVA